MRSSLFCDVTQRSYRRFGTTYRPPSSRNKQSSHNVHTDPCVTTHLRCFRHSWAALPLKIVRIGYPETSVTSYQSLLRNIPEERSSPSPLQRQPELMQLMYCHRNVTPPTVCHLAAHRGNALFFFFPRTKCICEFVTNI